MAFNYSPNIVRDSSLVLYLDAANTKSYPGNGTSWNDLSKGGNNGTLTNGPTFNTGSGGSIVFDGSNDYGSIPDITLTTAYTLASWVKINGSNGTEIISRYLPGFAQFEMWISGGKLYPYTYGNYGTAAIPSTTTVNDNKWYYVVGVFDGSIRTLSVYVNGILENSVSNGGVSTILNQGSGPIDICSYYNGGSGHMNGNIATIQIYNKPLSSSEILQNFNATKTRFGL